MADTYEHEKPHNITGQYQETPAPSEFVCLAESGDVVQIEV